MDFSRNRIFVLYVVAKIHKNLFQSTEPPAKQAHTKVTQEATERDLSCAGGQFGRPAHRYHRNRRGESTRRAAVWRKALSTKKHSPARRSAFKYSTRQRCVDERGISDGRRGRGARHAPGGHHRGHHGHDGHHGHPHGVRRSGPGRWRRSRHSGKDPACRTSHRCRSTP